MDQHHIFPVKFDPRFTRIFAILKDRIEQRCVTTVREAEDEPQLFLTFADDLPLEAFCIEQDDEGLHIVSSSPLGLLYGVGKFLRTSNYDGLFKPSPWRGVSAPRGSLRGMYFATHFHNWYHVASPGEITRYIEDLALWGVNVIMAIFPMINLQDWHDPLAEPALDMLRQYSMAAKDLGLQFATAINNTMFKDAPASIRAIPLPDPTGRRGNSGHPVCPSSPDGHAYILANARTLFEHLSGAGVDLLCHWPYDEGGCACGKCQPWGCNGYLRLSRDLTHLALEYFPNLKSILSTWMFDTPPEGEWQGLSDALARDAEGVDYILADAHEDFPRYPLEIGVPGNLPLVNFPEISMWGNWPWGGAGANPLPGRFQRLWNQVKHVVEGGFPYSEGLYEDMNKIIVSQFYWDPDRSARETLAEYIAYEFDPCVSAEVLEMVDLLETAASHSYQKLTVDAGLVEHAFALAESVQARLPAWARQNWRWEHLYLRALLDRERFAGAGLETLAAEAAMLRLIELYHCQLETDDPYHHRVRPPLKRAITLGEIK